MIKTKCFFKSDIVSSSAISEYDWAAEGDLFKAPEPIIEEPVMDLDPVAAAISMISCGEDVVSSQGLESTDIDALQSEQLLSEVFYECKKDLLEKTAIESSLCEILDIKFPVLNTDENKIQVNRQIHDVPLPKSVSLGCLSSMDWMQGAMIKPAFLEFPGIDFSEVYGMRRAFSEGDIKALGNGNGNVNLIQSPLERPLVMSNCTSEERREKLSRYRNKRTKRNFGRKIKYACRKALADSQPRIRGRFAKTEEPEVKRQ
ncbi:zinc finger protein CONSTANS-LIKE 9-like isoform X2 [Neltuma alba]|uniref:zinc finger protein CONSTANS-LIKE 9-like isoform X2 n=1 Tax=Neltuma alba TaxID=207710 RepID=UPI0010A4C3C7|nr:zinc finger protein CONSTANS-LIKE 9-like isoform X2 [Prosopis alba]XP_028806773.1 zinc finger protein CONSTANS-LIKE 9-like isoform X2 [Prosopis alba]